MNEPARANGDVREFAEPAYPALYTSFDACSAAFQRRFAWLTQASLIATVVAAAAGVVSIGDGPDWAAVTALVAFVAAGGCRLVLLREHPERAWYDARAGAESVKTLAWQYAVRGGSFAVDETRETREAARRRLTARFRTLIQATRGVTRAPAPHARQETTWMAQLWGAPLESRRRAYLEDRLFDQVHWYGDAAARHDRLARRWGVTTIALQVGGMLAATLRVTGTIDIDLLGVVAAAAAATTAWLESKDHSGLAEAYATTAHEIALARDDIPTELDEAQWATFVGDAEAAISREHTSWLARRRTQSTLGAK